MVTSFKAAKFVESLTLTSCTYEFRRIELKVHTAPDDSGDLSQKPRLAELSGGVCGNVLSIGAHSRPKKQYFCFTFASIALALRQSMLFAFLLLSLLFYFWSLISIIDLIFLYTHTHAIKSTRSNVLLDYPAIHRFIANSHHNSAVFLHIFPF